MNNNLTETLKKEQELLLEKISKARENGDIGTYKNLITALRDIIKLVRDEECTMERKVLETLTDLDINIAYFKGENCFITIQQQDENGTITVNKFGKVTNLKDYSFNANNGELALKLNIEPINGEYGRTMFIPKHTYEA